MTKINLLLFLFSWSYEDTIVVLVSVLVFVIIFVFFLVWLIFWILKRKNRALLEENNLMKNNKNIQDGQTTDLNTLDTSYDKTNTFSDNNTTEFDFDVQNKKPIDDADDDQLFDPIEKFKTEVIKLKERLDKEKDNE